MTDHRPPLKEMALGFALLSAFPLARALPMNFERDYLTLCFFRTVTGLPCPFCGLTHSFVLAMHGRWTVASQYHPLWWLAALAILFAAGAALRDAACGSDWLARCWRRSTTSPLLVAGLLVGFSLLRAMFFPLPG